MASLTIDPTTSLHGGSVAAHRVYSIVKVP
jgi:hypothetical protein